ncbi:DUF2255 family protein [Streptomyces reniochalinae]|uniref:DUF2255 family protein n=1 Tax=Streptomyces reniochalinae TaxID=2250578 RepID=A0A367EX65_9ACTN|nr:DUF2255 family protein [Streptomyces reniochalinae]RCG22175.1 DUF2255 family protein [Streptomyces reniochalinae]
MTWNNSDLETIASADELEISPQRRDGSLRRPTTVWVVRDGDELYVRSWRGGDGAWWRTAHSSHAGRVTAGGVTKDVVFTDENDAAVNDRVDDAYRTKYQRYSAYVGPMVADPARATTLRLTPQ